MTYKDPVVYKATNTVNNKSYIGKSINFKSRYKKHKYAKYYNTYFHRAIRKYGFDAFVFEILEDDIPIDQLIVRENYWIDHYRTLDKDYGYNLRKDSKESSGWSHSDEAKIKIGLSGIGRVPWNKGLHPEHILTEEGKKSFTQKMSGGGNPNAKTVEQYTMDGKLINVYDSATTAAKLLSISFGGICRAARGERKSYKSFIWKYSRGAYDSNIIVKSPLIAGNSL